MTDFLIINAGNNKFPKVSTPIYNYQIDENFNLKTNTLINIERLIENYNLVPPIEILESSHNNLLLLKEIANDKNLKEEDWILICNKGNYPDDFLQQVKEVNLNKYKDFSLILITSSNLEKILETDLQCYFINKKAVTELFNNHKDFCYLLEDCKKYFSKTKIAILEKPIISKCNNETHFSYKNFIAQFLN